jgi:ketosteroid isomerase-like protein
MTPEESERQRLANKAVVESYYTDSQAGDLTPFLRDHLAADFTAVAPNYVPLGGKVHTAQSFTDEVVPHLGRMLDYSRFTYENLIADGDQVCALVRIGIAKTPHTVLISEHWTVRAGRARSLLVIFFEPQDLLDSVGVAHGLANPAPA